MTWEETITGGARTGDRRTDGTDGDGAGSGAASPPDAPGAAEGRARYDFSADGYDRMLAAFENGDLADAEARRFFGAHFEDVEAAVGSSKRP